MVPGWCVLYTCMHVQTTTRIIKIMILIKIQMLLSGSYCCTTDNDIVDQKYIVVVENAPRLISLC